MMASRAGEPYNLGMKMMIAILSMLSMVLMGCAAGNVGAPVEVEAMIGDAAPMPSPSATVTEDAGSSMPTVDAAPSTPAPTVDAANPNPPIPVPVVDAGSPMVDAAPRLPPATPGVVSCLVTPVDGGAPHTYRCNGTGAAMFEGALVDFELAAAVGGPGYQGAYQGDAGGSVSCYTGTGTPPPCVSGSTCFVSLGGNVNFQGVCL